MLKIERVFNDMNLVKNRKDGMYMQKFVIFNIYIVLYYTVCNSIIEYNILYITLPQRSWCSNYIIYDKKDQFKLK